MPADRLSLLLHDLDDLPVAPAPAPAVRARGTAIRRRRQGAAGAGLLAVAALGAAVAVSGLPGGRSTSLQPAPFASPGTSATTSEDGPDVVDGTDLGTVRELTEDEVVLDRVVWFDQEELQERYRAEGRDPAEAVAYEVVDEREDSHRYPVSPDVEVTLTVGLAPPDLQGGSVPTTLEELRELLSDPGVAAAHLFDLTVQDGVVVRIDHRYAA